MTKDTCPWCKQKIELNVDDYDWTQTEVESDTCERCSNPIDVTRDVVYFLHKGSPPICPSCGKNPLKLPMVMNSLSRKDNETYICDDCGMREALEDYYV